MCPFFHAQQVALDVQLNVSFFLFSGDSDITDDGEFTEDSEFRDDEGKIVVI